MKSISPELAPYRVLFAAALMVAAVVTLLAAEPMAQAQTAVPDAPTGLATSSITHDGVTLTWDDPGNDSITGYQVLRRYRDGDEYGDGRGAPTFVAVVDDTGTPATSYTDISVTPRTRYVYRVKAINSAGTSEQSRYTNAETPSGPPPPSTPTGLTAPMVTHDRVTLSWDDPDDSSITGYQVLRRYRDGDEYEDGQGAAEFVSVVDDTGSPATTYTDTSVTARTRYVYRVKAINSIGLSGQSGYVNAETLATPPPVPGAPIGLAASAITHNSVALTWDDPVDTSISGYRVLRRVGDSGQFTTVEEDTGSPDTGYTDATVLADTGYWYQLIAVNTHGESPGSDVLSVRTPSDEARLTGVSVSGVTQTRATLTVSVENAADTEVYLRYSPANDRSLTRIIAVETSSSTLRFDLGGQHPVHSNPLLPASDYRVEVSLHRHFARGVIRPKLRTDSPPNTPGRPTITEVVSGDRSLAVAWRRPADSGGLPVTGYRVHWRLDHQVYTLSRSATTTDGHSLTIGSLRNRVPYMVRVVALNENGEGQPSEEVTFTPGMARLVGVSAGDATQTTAVATVALRSAINDTVYLRYRSAAQSAWLQVPGQTTSSERVAFSISGLAAGTDYQVQASLSGEFSESEDTWFRTASAANTPGPPNNVTLTDRRREIVVDWDPPANDGGSRVTEYLLQWRGQSQLFGPVERGLKTTRLGATIDEVIDDPEHSVRVIALNGNGQGTPSEEASGSYLFEAPTGLAILAAHHDSVTLTWDDPQDSTIQSYQVLRRPRDGSEYGDGLGAPEFAVVADRTDTSITTYTDTSVTPMTRFDYQVRAWDSLGLSDASDYVSTETPAAPAGILHSTPRGTRPNVVLILADDLGWGDIETNNPNSAMTTPRIDGVAAAGVNFTDAHSPSSACTGTRYGLLAGRYSWRSWLRAGVLNGYDRPLIGPDQPTLGTLLQNHGYRTAAVGKWHLGMDFGRLSDIAEVTSLNRGIDFAAEIADGPINHGFDEFFGTSANLTWHVPVYIRDNRFTMVPTRSGSVTHGNITENDVLDRLTGEAVSFIERSARNDEPFFLYLPLNAPHVPLAPGDNFRGRTSMGPYGDFVAQVDWTVGQVLDTLMRVGEYENTLVIFTSDNGSEMGRMPNHLSSDHTQAPEVHAYYVGTHQSNGDWKHGKGSVYEGGHRIPFLLQWPSAIKAGLTIDATVSLTDVYATLADILEEERASGAAPDSVSLLPLLLGEAEVRGTPVVHHSNDAEFAVRDGRWKLLLTDPPELFDMEQDPQETRNVARDNAGEVARLKAALADIRSAEDGTLPGDATLRSLRLFGVDLGPFDPSVRSYTATVDAEIKTVEVMALPSVTDARVGISTPDGKLLYGKPLRGRVQIELAEPTTTVNATVFAPDGSATSTYWVTVRRPNKPALGAPAVSGAPEAGHTLAADVSAISDPDGLTNATFSYQWMAGDGNLEWSIHGANVASYTLQAPDIGGFIKVRVGFTDDAGNIEHMTSAPTATVSRAVTEGSPAEPPPAPLNVRAVANDDGSVTVSWDAPGDDSITGYEVLRRKPGEAEYSMVESAVRVSAGETTYTEDGPTPDVLHAYSVRAVNEAGPSERSNYDNAVPHRPTPMDLGMGAPTIYLTFDDGPREPHTAQVLDALEKYGARAMFFVVGSKAARHPDIIATMAAAGHGVGNHAWQHERLTELSRKDFDSTVSRTQEQIGAYATRCLRPPYGDANANTRAWTASLGLQEVMWTVNPRDHAGPGVDKLVSRLSEVSNGSVVLLHDSGNSATIEAVRVMLDQWARRGYQFRPVCEPSKVPAASPNDPSAGAPTIRGPVQVGMVLTADTSYITDGDGLSGALFSYQWFAGKQEIVNATDSSYLIAAEHEGKAMAVEVSFTDDAGNAQQLTSVPTAPVTAAERVPGSPEVPQELSVTPTGNAGELLAAWHAPGNQGGPEIVGYDVEWKLSSGYWGTQSDVREIRTTGTSQKITGLAEASQYVVRVRAVSQGLEGAASVGVPAAPTGPAPLLAEFQKKPTSHEGARSQFSVDVAFSEAIANGYIEFRDGSLLTDGGTVLEASRVDRRSDLWRLTILPHDNGHVTIRMLANGDCSVWGAICTADGRKLSNRLEITVLGPGTPATTVANAPATGAPAVTGTPQVDQTLTVDTSAIADQDGLDHVSFEHQWLADDSEIPDATGDGYTLTDADEGKAIKVRVSFTDDAGHGEILTSAATAAVAPPPLTASFHTDDTPENHDGQNAFTFELRFSEEFSLSYRTLRDEAFTVDGGAVVKASRLVRSSNLRWRITVQPDSDADVSVVLPITTNCSDDGAICTDDERMLSNRLELTVQGP